MSSLNYSEFCRLCLVKERVSTPIFEGEGDVRRIFLKIATCLPIKVSREDHLPKSICDDCLYKVENQYQFWNTTANSEKQLHQWLGSSVGDSIDVKNIHGSGMDPMEMKQESMDMDQGSELSKSLSRVEAVLAEEAGRVAAAAHGEDEDEEEEESEEEGSNSEESEDDDNDADEPNKDEDDEDEAYDEELEPTTFVNVSLACDEAGPSGTQQQTSVAPSTSTSAPAASGSGKRKRSRSKLRKREDIPASKSTTKGQSSTTKGASNSKSIPAVPFVVIDPNTSSVGNVIEVEVSHIKPTPNSDKEQLSKIRKLPIDHLIEATVGTDSEGPPKSTGRINVPVDTLVKAPAHKHVHSKRGMTAIDNLIKATVTDLKPFAKTNLIHSSMTIIDADGRNRLITIDKNISDAQGYNFDGPIKHDSSLTISLNSIDSSLPETSVVYATPGGVTESNRSAGVFTASEGILYNPLHLLEGGSGDEFRVIVPPVPDQDTQYVVLLQEPQEVVEDTAKTTNNPTCTDCGKVFQTFSRLDRHLVTHSEDRPFPCVECDKCFKRTHELKVHMKTHTKDKKYVCDICGNSFTQKHHLSVHRRRHVGDFKYCCDICTKGFHSKDELQSHKNTQHALNEFVCETCGRACANKQNFKKHLRLHDPIFLSIKKEQCQECGKMFVNKSSLRLHSLSHTGENKFPCGVCGKTLLSKDSLRAHRTIHTGEKPYVCDVCGKTFRVRENMRVHQRTHTGERPFSCTECPRAFRQRAALVAHLRYHTGERPFKCDLCGKGYVTRTFLSQHMVTHQAADVREDIKRECLDSEMGVE